MTGDRTTAEILAEWNRDSCFEDCGQTIRDHFTSQGIGISAVTRRPRWLVPNGYVPLNLTCPHGVSWHAEPSAEQRACWAVDGVE